MNNVFKHFLMLTMVVGLVAGCATTGEQDDQAERDRQAQMDREAAEAEAAAAEPEEAEPELPTTFYFGFDESTLRPDARAALTAHAERLQDEPRNIRLEGHADERGSREYNMALGERRANAVRDFLVLQGVDASLIETVSYGEERPAVMGSYEGAWEQNRRVELK